MVHGHPPYATALGASEGSFEYLTHDAVLFADGLAFYEETPELIQGADMGKARDCTSRRSTHRYIA